MMGILDNILRKHGEPAKGSSDSSGMVFKPGTKDHKVLVRLRAKALIEELVSPLSEPNQKLIDEVIDIISQSVSLPDNMVNKDAVLKTTKELLFQLVDPISNPNKLLIDELLKIIADPNHVLKTVGGSQAKARPKSSSPDYSTPERSKEIPQNVDRMDPKNMKGQAGLRMRKEQAVSQAPFPSQATPAPNAAPIKTDKETKSIMNLLLEQIKELITITNNLNTKLKSHQVRLDNVDSTMSNIQKKSDEFDERMVTFEKNMEKFIGLYEVVTNQYNPFVETNEIQGYNKSQQVPASTDVPFQDDQVVKQPARGSEAEGYVSGNETQDQGMPDNMADNPQDETTPVQGSQDTADDHERGSEDVSSGAGYMFSINGKNIGSLEALADAIISMSDEDFSESVLVNRSSLVTWVREGLGKADLADELSKITRRPDYIKVLMKEIHSLEN